MRQEQLNLIDARVVCPFCGRKQTSLLNEEKGEYEWVCDLCQHSFQTDLDYRVIQEVPAIKELVDEEPIRNEEPVHTWFGLSYANYLTLPRSVLEAMPVEWQKRFVSLLGEMEAEFPVSWPPEGTYRVSLVGPSGRFVKDALAEYRRPDSFLIESLRQKGRAGYLGNINGPGGDPDTV